jgi:putative ATPase
MIEAGEDPLYVVRRLVRFASEDIGMADPGALVQAISCYQTVHFIGLPEANDALAQCVIYLALAPKDRAVDTAYAKAAEDVKNERLDPIPLDIRNAPTKMMKDFGFGKDYKPYSKKSHLPDNLKKRKYWQEK